MGPDPLLSASLPLPLALSTTLQDNYLSLVRRGKGVKLNSHWLSLIAFLDLLDYKLNWRTWPCGAGSREGFLCVKMCVRERFYVCMCLFVTVVAQMNTFLGGLTYVYVCVSPHSSRGEPGFLLSVLRMTCPDSAVSDRLSH